MDTPTPPGRTPGRIASRLRQRIAAGELAPGSLLPSLRELAAEHRASLTTVSQAAQQLVREGLVAAEPRRGFRIAARAEDGRPVAFVTGQPDAPQAWERYASELRQCVQEAADAQAMPVLGIGSGGRSRAEILRQVRDAGAWGVLTDDAGLLPGLRAAGLPTVLIDAAWPEADADAVMQGDYVGGWLAAKHLLDSGLRRIGWLGPLTRDGHSLARHAGAAAAFRHAGCAWPAALVVETDDGTLAARTAALLRRSPRPEGLLVLWRDVAVAVAATARELGLRLGTDLALVGWCPQEQWRRDYAPGFDGPPPPSVTWSLRTMARLALARLGERRAHAQLEAVSLQVPMRLVTGPALDG